jgi:hypothetical protein
MNFKAISLTDIPAMSNMDNPNAKIVVDFLESGIDAAEVTDFTYGLESTASSIRSVLHRTRLPVKVIQRQKRLFLIRTDIAKEAAK